MNFISCDMIILRLYGENYTLQHCHSAISIILLLLILSLSFTHKYYTQQLVPKHSKATDFPLM